MKRITLFGIGLVLGALVSTLPAQVPQLINYQGRVVVGTTNFDGSGQFKFALVNATGTTTFWSNDNTSTAGSEPTAAVTLPVSKGLYSVLLGDATIPNMVVVPAAVFTNPDVRLRVWFNDGTNGSQLLTPDQRIAAVGYALMATNVVDGAITGAKIAPGAVGSAQLGSNLTLGGTTTGSFSGNVSGNATNFTGSLAGNVTGTQGATVVSTVGGVTAANVAAGANLANAATNANTASTIVKRDASGNFAAGTMTGNVTGSAASFTGSLVGNVTGTQGATVVGTVGGVSAANVAAGANLANAATNLNTASAIVKRDASGDFSAGTITAAENLSLPTTNGTGTAGVITQNGSRLIHSFGSGNFFAGTSTGNFTMTGSGNAAFGFNALGFATSGSNNVAVGLRALEINSSGTSNVALGPNTLRNVTSGGGNIAIGESAGSAVTTGNGNILIGQSGVAGESNTTRIGGSKTFINGIRGVTTTVPNAIPVLIDGSGQLGTVSSSRRYKENIADMGDASSRIRALRPVAFRYKQPYADGAKPVQYGLIAEEVAEVFPELAVFNEAGEPETVKYQDLTPLLLNEFLKERERAAAAEAALREENTQMKKRLAELETRLDQRK